MRIEIIEIKEMVLVNLKEKLIMNKSNHQFHIWHWVTTAVTISFIYGEELFLTKFFRLLLKYIQVFKSVPVQYYSVQPESQERPEASQ